MSLFSYDILSVLEYVKIFYEILSVLEYVIILSVGM